MQIPSLLSASLLAGTSQAVLLKFVRLHSDMFAPDEQQWYIAAPLDNERPIGESTYLPVYRLPRNQILHHPGNLKRFEWTEAVISPTARNHGFVNTATAQDGNNPGGIQIIQSLTGRGARADFKWRRSNETDSTDERDMGFLAEFVNYKDKGIQIPDLVYRSEPKRKHPDDYLRVLFDGDAGKDLMTPEYLPYVYLCHPTRDPAPDDRYYATLSLQTKAHRMLPEIPESWFLETNPETAQRQWGKYYAEHCDEGQIMMEPSPNDIQADHVHRNIDRETEVVPVADIGENIPPAPEGRMETEGQVPNTAVEAHFGDELDIPEARSLAEQPPRDSKDKKANGRNKPPVPSFKRVGSRRSLRNKKNSAEPSAGIDVPADPNKIPTSKDLLDKRTREQADNHKPMAAGEFEDIKKKIKPSKTELQQQIRELLQADDDDEDDERDLLELVEKRKAKAEAGDDDDELDFIPKETLDILAGRKKLVGGPEDLDEEVEEDTNPLQEGPETNRDTFRAARIRNDNIERNEMRNMHKGPSPYWGSIEGKSAPQEGERLQRKKASPSDSRFKVSHAVDEKTIRNYLMGQHRRPSKKMSSEEDVNERSPEGQGSEQSDSIDEDDEDDEDDEEDQSDEETSNEEEEESDELSDDPNSTLRRITRNKGRHQPPEKEDDRLASWLRAQKRVPYAFPSTGKKKNTKGRNKKKTAPGPRKRE